MLTQALHLRRISTGDLIREFIAVWNIDDSAEFFIRETDMGPKFYLHSLFFLPVYQPPLALS